MKRIFLLLPFLFASLPSCAQEADGSRVITKTFVFEADHFPVTFHDSRHLKYHSFWPVDDKQYEWPSGRNGEMGDAGIPWLHVDIQLQPYEELVEWSFEKHGESIFLEDAKIQIMGQEDNLSEDYPRQTVVMTGIKGEPLSDPHYPLTSWSKMPFMVCPFRYDSSARSLFLADSITLNIHLRQHDFSYRPFIEEGKTWAVHHWPRNYGQESDEEHYDQLEYLYFGGDTIIAGRQCKLWMKEIHSLKDASAPVTTEVIAPLFEDAQQVFFFYPGETTPRLLYDFRNSDQELTNLTFFIPADSTHIPFQTGRSIGQKVYSSDTYPTPNIAYINPVFWLEGVGSTSDPTVIISHNSSRGEWYWLILCQVGNQILFHRPQDTAYDYAADIRAISPSAHSGGSKIVYRKSSDSKCFDLSGHRLAAPPARGLYIEDGKVRVK